MDFCDRHYSSSSFSLCNLKKKILFYFLNDCRRRKSLFVSCRLFQPDCAVSRRPYRCVVTVTHLEIKGLMDFSLSLSFCLTLKKDPI